RPDRAGHVAGLVLVGGPDVDEIDVALATSVPEPADVVRAQRLHAVVRGHARGGGRRLHATAVARLGGGPRGAALEREAREPPTPRAVLECDDRVGQAHPSQRLRADVRARAAPAMDDDRRLRALDELADAQHELAAGHADRTGNAAAVVFLVRPRV